MSGTLVQTDCTGQGSAGCASLGIITFTKMFLVKMPGALEKTKSWNISATSHLDKPKQVWVRVTGASVNSTTTQPLQEVEIADSFCSFPARYRKLVFF